MVSVTVGHGILPWNSALAGLERRGAHGDTYGPIDGKQQERGGVIP
jgi:hypothetical protein